MSSTAVVYSIEGVVNKTLKSGRTYPISINWIHCIATSPRDAKRQIMRYLLDLGYTPQQIKIRKIWARKKNKGLRLVYENHND